MKNFLLDKSTFLLTIIFVVATALIFFMMGLTYKSFEKQSDNSDWMTHSYETSLELQKLYSNLKDIETERRNYLLKRNQNSEDFAKAKIIEINQQTKELEKRVSNNPDQKKNLEELVEMIQYKFRIVDQSFSGEIDFNDGDLVRSSLLSGENVMQSISDKIDEMLDNEENLLQERKNNFLFSQRSNPFYLYVIGIFSLALLGFSFYRINNDLKNIRDVNQKLELNAETLSLAEIIGEYGIWSYNYETEEYSYSDNVFKLYGYKNVVPLEDDTFSRFIFDEDRKKIRLKFDKIEDGQYVRPFTFRVQKRDGEVRIFQVFAKEIVTKNELKQWWKPMMVLKFRKSICSFVDLEIFWERNKAVLWILRDWIWFPMEKSLKLLKKLSKKFYKKIRP